MPKTTNLDAEFVAAIRAAHLDRNLLDASRTRFNELQARKEKLIRRAAQHDGPLRLRFFKRFMRALFGLA